MKIRIVLLTLCLLVALILPSMHSQSVLAASTIVYASKDNYIDKLYPTTNYGTLQAVYAGMPADTYPRRGLLEFPITWGTTIPAGATITSATLYMRYNGHAADDPVGRTIRAQRLLRLDWSETTSTWNNYKSGSTWTTAGAGSSTSDYTTSGQASATVPASYGWMTWTITAQVQWAQTNNKNVAIRVVDSSEALAYMCSFSSREGPYAPYIVINYIAPPTVTTGSATNVLDTTATLGATITSTGGSTITTRGVQYGLTQTPTWSSYETGSFGTGAYTRDITGLSPATTYWFRGYAINTGGTGYGSWVPFTTKDYPSVTTLDATYIGVVTARLNGQLTNDGGDTCQVRFQYGESPGDYTFATSWVTKPVGYFYVDIDELFSDKTYYFRAQAKNSVGTMSGSEKSFTTEVGLFPPTSFSAHATDGSHISLAWIKGGGADNTVIRMAVGTYSPGPTSGTGVYLGTGSSVVAKNLVPGTTYYFRAWGEAGGNFSEDYIDALATTLAGTPVTTPTSPTEPTNWFLSPDYTRLSNLPLYSQTLTAFDAYDLPYNTGWLILALFIAALLGAAALFISNGEIWIAIITIITTIVVESLMGMIGMWIILVVAIIGGIYAFLKVRPA